MRDSPAPKAPASSAGDRAEVNATFSPDNRTEVRGTVRIAPKVLIQLIETTVSVVPGVIELRPHRQPGAGDTALPAGKAFDDGKVRVFVAGDQIEADVSISIARGTNVSSLSDAIRRSVGVAAGRMLGMTMRNVNIYIDSIVEPAT